MGRKSRLLLLICLCCCAMSGCNRAPEFQGTPAQQAFWKRFEELTRKGNTFFEETFLSDEDAKALARTVHPALKIQSGAIGEAEYLVTCE
ncbi:MAG: hypothetical protein MUC92_13980, partial [Fimbriimonadaceae bacterium]|nr:hypothetical protein [Fimbriimonadaceae bacterium]